MNTMEVIILKDADKVAEEGARRVCALVRQRPNAVLGLATGTTPIAMYKKLIVHYQAGKISLSKVITFNLDEYLGLTPDNPQSYRSFMNRELFDHIDIDGKNTHLPTCRETENPKTVSLLYEEKIKSVGGIDMQVLGIGSNGHIGFNEPTSSLSSRTRVKTLSEKTVSDNSRLFKSNEYQPYLAITMGIATIMEAHQILLLATGDNKSDAVSKMIEGPVTSRCPASVLQLHQKATILIDEAAASKLELQEYYKWVDEQNTELLSNLASG